MVPSYLLVGRNVGLQTLVEAHAQRNRHLRNFMNHVKLNLNNENVFVKNCRILAINVDAILFQIVLFRSEQNFREKTINYGKYNVVIFFNNYDQAKVDSLKF